MTSNLKMVSCDPMCGFMVRSHDEEEIVKMVILHAKKTHKMKITQKDVQEKMQTV